MYLILAPELPNCISVNAVGKDILDLCDNTRTIKEIAEAISVKKRENFEENLPKILHFFNYLEDKKFAFRKPIQIKEFSPKKPEKLVSLWLNITGECNLRCRHCHSSFGSPLEDELTTEEIKTIIEESSHFPDCGLVISGGEPFCRYDITEILKAASNHFGKRVFVITNGTLVDDETANMLATRDIRVQISLEGPDEESNDAIRGRGVFKKALKTMRTLKEMGVTPVVRMTLLRTNIDKIREIIAFSKQEDIGPVVVGTLQRSGRAYRSIQDIDPTTDELIKTYRKIIGLDPDLDFITFDESLGPAVTRSERIDLCGAGTSILSVGADGSVYPCAGLMYPEFLAGNVKEKSLKKIWKGSFVLQKIRSLSVSEIPGCRDCPIHYICGGGCLVDIFWEHGHLQGKTPRCEFLHAMKWDELKRTEYTKKKVE